MTKRRSMGGQFEPRPLRAYLKVRSLLNLRRQEKWARRVQTMLPKSDREIAEEFEALAKLERRFDL